MAEVKEKGSVGMLFHGADNFRHQGALPAFFKALFVADVGAAVEGNVTAQALAPKTT